MPYKLDYADSVKLYLRGLTGLSRHARIKLYAQIHAVVPNLTDEFRNDPANRAAPVPLFLWLTILLIDDDQGGRLHTFVLAVDDSAAPYGLLRIVYADHVAGEIV